MTTTTTIRNHYDHRFGLIAFATYKKIYIYIYKEKKILIGLNVPMHCFNEGHKNNFN